MIELNKTLYKKDSKDKIRTITIYTEQGTIYQVSGLIDGKKVTNKSSCSPKNIGKSNETTKEQQAISEAKAKVAKKIDEGYFLTREEAENEQVILPMLAYSFDKHEKKVEYPCWVQPKLDGMRALGETGKLISRKGKEITTLPHLLKNSILGIIDGELYAHGLTFQENMKLIKKYRAGESEDVKYHVYDMVNRKLPFIQRYLILSQSIKSLTNVKLVPCYDIHSKEDLLKYHKQFLEEGYEGTMIRHGDDGYKINGRSSSLLKFKDFQDIACTIVDVIPSEKVPIHGKFICQYNGHQFGCGMRMTHEEREDILTNKQNFIGKTAEIRFFEYTDEGTPRFPVCVGIRLDC